MRHMDLFSGIGGFALAAREVWGGSYEPMLFCDNSEFCQAVIRKRFPGVPVWGDIRGLIAHATGNRCTGKGEKIEVKEGLQQKPRYARKLEGGFERLYRGINLLTGGFPCQPFSHAGKRRSRDDNRYLWPEMLECVRLFSPRWVIAENVPGILNIEGGLVFEQVCLSLEGEGYEVWPLIIPACGVNAPHRRDRVWIVAHLTNPNSRGRSGEAGIRKYDSRGVQGEKQNNNTISPNKICDAPNTQVKRLSDRQGNDEWEEQEQNNRNNIWNYTWSENWPEVAARLCGIFNGVSDWMDGCLGEIVGGDEYDATKAYETENLRILREAVQKEEVWGEIGGLHEVAEKEILLSLLCRIEERASRQDNIQPEGEKDFKSEGMRSLWKHSQAGLSPYRRKHKEQRARQLTTIVPSLPHEIALEIAEIWDNIWVAYSAMQNREIKSRMDGLELPKARHRVERLKALGNAVVPQVAAEIMRAIKEADEMHNIML